MKLLINPERGGILVEIQDVTTANGEREQGEQMLLAVAVLEEIHGKARFVVEGEKLPPLTVQGWLARKAGTNTVIGSQPSAELLGRLRRLEKKTGQPWELRVKNVPKVGRAPFLRPSRVKNQKTIR